MIEDNPDSDEQAIRDRIHAGLGAVAEPVCAAIEACVGEPAEIVILVARKRQRERHQYWHIVTSAVDEGTLTRATALLLDRCSLDS
jgi:hypothetical protein